MRLLEYELKQELLSTIKVEQVTQKPPFYVPESMSVVKLMRELLARKTHMAIVVNEHGKFILIIVQVWAIRLTACFVYRRRRGHRDVRGLR
jgi:Mg2+/Co2+ transporter CorB